MQYPWGRCRSIRVPQPCGLRNPALQDRTMINLITLTDPRSAAAEAYQGLRTNLEFSSLEQPLHSILVTSADDMAEKSNAVANLAVAMALAGGRPTLGCGGFGPPPPHENFRPWNQRG